MEALLDDTITYEPLVEVFRSACQKISAFYFVERYPLVAEKAITQEDVRTSLEQVDGLIKKLRAGDVGTE